MFINIIPFGAEKINTRIFFLLGAWQFQTQTKKRLRFSSQYDMINAGKTAGRGIVVFNIGMTEVVVVLLVAFLVVGPKDLPKVARWLARQVKAIRRMIADLKKETGWDELTADVNETKKDIDETLKQADVTGDVRSAAEDWRRTVNGVKKDIRDADKEIRKK